MVATPITLEDALRFSGYTIDPYEYPGAVVTVPAGEIVIPPMILTRLSWGRAGTAPLGSAFYLDRLPAFHPMYRPVQLSLILDRFRSRRLGYDTTDEFGLAVRRWGNLHLGAMSTLTRRYMSVATDLPLDEVDMIRSAITDATASSQSSADATGMSSTESDGTDSASDTATSSDTSASNSKGRDASSDFPQGMLSGDLDYASGAVDRIGEGVVTGTGSTTGERSGEDHRSTLAETEDHRSESSTSTDTRTEDRTERGRSGRSVMELLELQRAAFLNVDAELLDGMESLFLGVFDRSEAERNVPSGYGPFGW